MIPSDLLHSSVPTARSSSSALPQTQATTTTTQTVSLPQLPRSQTPDGTLRLRGGPVHSRRVTWSEEVIDNEGLGRKKSKVCCIFKRNREFGESSDESSSDDSSSDDSDIGDGKRKGGPQNDNKRCDKGHEHNHDNNDHSHDHGHRNSRRENRRRPPSPNAYEKIPRNPTKKKEESSSGTGTEANQAS